jgi:formate dehydrogenase alpha subunit
MMAEPVYLDGRPIAAVEGQSILDTMHAAGVEAPALCHDARLSPQGTCRLCLVEVEGRADPVAACTTAAEPGMRVIAGSAALEDYRRALLEMVLSETPPPEECPRCSLLGPCHLHALADRYSARADRYPGLARRASSQDPNPFIERDYRWCILCYRCTRICQVWEMAGAMVAAGRGQGTYITSLPTDRLLDSPCTLCGQCINTCPTGALMDRKLVRQLAAMEDAQTHQEQE